ncbi:MAG: histidine phosphatase family protein [Bacteroidota bacterium]
MKTLVIARHAKSDWPESVADIDRPLKPRGIKDATWLGELLKQQEFQPDHIISSPANRARSTAQIIADQVRYTKELAIERSVYYEGAGQLLSLIQDLPEQHETVMIFGHNPTMENVVRYLLQADAHYEMPTCGMACFESYGRSWKDFVNQCRMRWLLVPRLKRKV